MNALGSSFLTRGAHTGRRLRTFILAAGLIGVVLLLVLGCPINVPRPETGEPFGEQRAAGAKAISTFSFASPAATGTIDESAKTITVSAPYATNATALVATFATTGASVKVGSIVQVSGTTANDFTSPVTYTVTAEDGSTASYVVMVTVSPSSGKAITSFSFGSPAATGTIDEKTKAIAIVVPYGTDTTALVASFTTTSASVKVGSTQQISGSTADDFSEPVTYAVTAQDGSTATYTVTVAVAPPAGTGISLTSVRMGLYPGTIDESARTVFVAVPDYFNVAGLVATFAATGSIVRVGPTVQVSGVTVNDFTNPVIYTVYADSGSTASYTITVRKTTSPSQPKYMWQYRIVRPVLATGVIDQMTGSVQVTVPYGTDVSAMVAEWSILTGLVRVGSVPQVYGVTPNNFSNPVTYTLYGFDNWEGIYTVSVGYRPFITAFSIAGQALPTTINQDQKSIEVRMPIGTDLRTLVAQFETTPSTAVRVDSVVQQTGTTANDFTHPVTYTLTAADGSTTTYTVTVTAPFLNAKAITYFALLFYDVSMGWYWSEYGTIDEDLKTIAVTTPQYTDLTSVGIAFETTGVRVSVGSVEVVSGETVFDISSGSLTVTAADGSTQDYSLTISWRSGA